jgi:hypothetical protein
VFPVVDDVGIGSSIPFRVWHETDFDVNDAKEFKFELLFSFG